jgi:hypothetical protein
MRLINAQHVTDILRSSCKQIGASLGIKPEDISARALRAGGMMALVHAGIDPYLIRLYGRWKSWAMLEYLRRSATDTSDFALKC